jgi:hypothetical protein
VTSTKKKYVNIFAWSILGINLLLTFLVSGQAIASVSWALIYFGWVILSFLLVFTWLPFSYRAFFQRWAGWVASLALMIAILFLLSSNYFSLPSELSLFLSILALPALWFFSLANIIFLWHRDMGLAFLGWGTAICIWSFFIAWRYQGNLIELWINGLNHPSAPFPLWWLNTLFCLSSCILPIAVISFLGHTFRLINRELSIPNKTGSRS